MHAEVVFDLPLWQSFTYAIPETLRDVISPGIRVLVPFGRRILTGYVLSLSESPPSGVELKPITDVLDLQPLFTPELLKLANWMAEYYLCGPGEALKAALPAGINLTSRKIVRLCEGQLGTESQSLQKLNPTEARILAVVKKRKKIAVSALQKTVRGVGIHYSLQKLVSRGVLEMTTEVQGKAKQEKLVRFIRLLPARLSAATDDRLTEKQLHLIETLDRAGGSMRQRDLLRFARTSSAVLSSLLRKGYVEAYERRIERDYYGDLHVPPSPKLVLNKEQQEAVDRICAALDGGQHQTFLIHGVTGSGKTQVYIEAIRHTLSAGKDAVVLVPEISLTPQAVQRYRSEFQDLVAVMHSRMSRGERYDAWSKVREGRARVVVGPRSAVFAPVQKLGILIVDEEHENSYKQTDAAPRYHARDVAVMRAALAGAVAVLGSATPSLESYFNALGGKYTLLEMRKRIDDVPLPGVVLYNLAGRKPQNADDEPVLISPLLLEKIADKLARREQVILLQNRRGFAAAVRCESCGYVEMCPNCNISLSYHLQGLRMRCHYCDLNRKAPSLCPQCGGHEIQYRGVGTQRVERWLQKLLPQARIVRMDLDTTRGKKGHDRILHAFEARKYDILIGTQMIAKGLDFPQVTLVGVISADTGLYLPDFRAAERTFQLMTQVAGRAGRKDTRGEVIIQTYSPGHYALVAAQQHDFKQFYAREIADRRSLRYPPFGRLILIQTRHKVERKARQAIELLARLLSQSPAPYQILGPAPAPLARLQEYYRFQILLKCDRRNDPGGGQSRRIVRQAAEQFRLESHFRDVHFAIDVDPTTIL